MDENAVETAVREAVEFVVPVVELMGAAVVLVGAALAMWMFCASAVRMRSDSYEQTRLTLGRRTALNFFLQRELREADARLRERSPSADDGPATVARDGPG